MKPEVTNLDEKIGPEIACYDIPDCPICGGRSVWWCRWHSPRGNDYYICARCDAKLTDENAMEYIEKVREAGGEEGMSKYKGQLAQKAPELDDIPTECRRCRRIFNDKDMVWITVNPGEKWFVCEHCAEVIGYCNRMIGMFRGFQNECKESLEKRPEETPMQRALRLLRENSHYGLDGRKKE